MLGRYEKALERMRLLLGEPVAAEAVKDKETVRVIDLCAGTGVAGIALAKILLEKGLNVDLHLVDLRGQALRQGMEAARSLVGLEPRIHVLDCRSVHELGMVFDIALIYGWSTPHFSPWDMVRVLASASQCLDDNGVLVIHDFDRRYEVFIKRGYRLVTPIYTGDKVLLQLHAGYDLEKGTIRRVVVELSTGKRIEYSVFYWGLAELAALAWTFFKHVKMVRLGGSQALIVATAPRRKLLPQDFSEET